MRFPHIRFAIYAGSLAMACIRSGGQSQATHSPVPQTCHGSPQELSGGALHILRVKVISSSATDGTYADGGYGQGEFDSVKLLEVIKSPVPWSRGHIFRVHPFSGERKGETNYAPERLLAGKEYLIVYTYYLDHEPRGEADLIGLTRCGVHEDTPEDRQKLLSSYAR
jgi:hypothetical protein